jgi:hypothetical protein
VSKNAQKVGGEKPFFSSAPAAMISLIERSQEVTNPLDSTAHWHPKCYQPSKPNGMQYLAQGSSSRLLSLSLAIFHDNGRVVASGNL